MLHQKKSKHNQIFEDSPFDLEDWIKKPLHAILVAILENTVLVESVEIEDKPFTYYDDSSTGHSSEDQKLCNDEETD